LFASPALPVIVRITTAILVWLLLSVAAASAWAKGVGKVIFVSGQVQRLLPDGRLKAVAMGQDVQVGTRYITGKGGYLHLRMEDDAYYSLRPNSRFYIEEYSWHPDQPGRNRIRVWLERGSVRAITGKAGEANKQGYRLNTPVAAIGIRGTDYITYHNRDTTRVAVSAGAVVVSPFNSQCTPRSLGACGGRSAVLLMAGAGGDYVEVRRNQPVPQIKKGGWSPQAQKRDAVSSGSATAATTGGATDERASLQNAVALAPDPHQKPSDFWWGRWGQPEVTARLKDPVWLFTTGNVGYALLQSADSQMSGYPAQGQVAFDLAAGEARLRKGDGVWSPARITGGTLGIDFAQGSFRTRLQGSAADLGSWTLNAAGAVQPDGTLASNPAKSDAGVRVNGAVNGDASQAAYLFSKPFAEGLLVGVTHWRAAGR
jgi:hypothetical protein